MTLETAVSDLRSKLVARISEGENLRRLSKRNGLDQSAVTNDLDRLRTGLSNLDSLTFKCSRTFGQSPNEKANHEKLRTLVGDLKRLVS